jgi:peptidoglycan/xylan/chitin deacetylase (PgdA/CDA1 family)
MTSFFRSKLADAYAGLLASTQQRVTAFDGRAPAVTFSFDDFPRTALIMGGAILERFGVHGTYYAAPALRDSSGEQGEHFTSDDLDALLAKGHELGSHTYSHVSSRSLSCTDYCADAARGRRTIEEQTRQRAESFSYPFGHVTLRTKRLLAPQFASARGIRPGFNGPQVDLNLLRANRIYGGVDQAAPLQALITENVRRRNWLIFYTHDVRPEPSAYGCTPALFESIVACAAHSGSRILTVAQVLREMGMGSGQCDGVTDASKGASAYQNQF